MWGDRWMAPQIISNEKPCRIYSRLRVMSHAWDFWKVVTLSNLMLITVYMGNQDQVQMVTLAGGDCILSDCSVIKKSIYGIRNSLWIKCLPLWRIPVLESVQLWPDQLTSRIAFPSYSLSWNKNRRNLQTTYQQFPAVEVSPIIELYNLQTIINLRCPSSMSGILSNMWQMVNHKLTGSESWICMGWIWQSNWRFVLIQILD